MNPEVKSFFDPATSTFTHVVYDATGGTAAVVDSVLDYDPKSGRTSTKSADEVIAFLGEARLRLALEELLAHQLSLREVRLRIQADGAPTLPSGRSLQTRFLAQLPRESPLVCPQRLLATITNIGIHSPEPLELEMYKSHLSPDPLQIKN